MPSVLITASTFSHIMNFHLPYLRRFRELGWQVHVACGGAMRDIPFADVTTVLPLEKKMSSPANFRAAKLLRDMMERSFDILNNHPLNLARAAAGKHKANSLWFWGAGTKPKVQNFKEKTGLTGAMISAVDLLKGIAVGAGMKVYNVPGATGSIDTNWEGKAQAAIDALLKDGCDYAYIHVEAPDEMGHQGRVEDKVKSIEYLDSRLIARVKQAMEAAGEDYRMLILPDHPTPLRIRTHTSNPVPYLLYDSTHEQKKRGRFTEESARNADNFEPNGYKLLERFLAK